MGELVGDEKLFLRGGCLMLAAAKDYVVADGVSPGADGGGGLSGFGTGVGADVAEAVAETRLHERTHRGGEGLAGLGEDLLEIGWGLRAGRAAGLERFCLNG